VPRCDALDWMKAIGITLVVYGHVAHATTVPWTPPIYVKQFGVAFFLFAAAVTLAREHRSRLDVLVARLVPVYLFGIATALAMTAIGLAAGTGADLSNYLPFMAGANVFVNHFPANPTTWYLGTYIHAVLLWAVLLSGRRLGVAAIVLALVIEVPLRAVLMQWAGSYVAYMLLTNWLSVFVAGLVIGAQPIAPARGGAVRYLLPLTVGVALSATLIGSLSPVPEFPFMTIGSGASGVLGVSIASSAWYLAVTLLVFRAAERVPVANAARFLARHSLIIMLAHMPIFFALNPVLAGWGWSYGARVAIELVICLPVLALVSAVILSVVRPQVITARIMASLNQHALSRSTAPPRLASLEPR
jgi:fucose 4-O-acetylase-like acetyltransferase